MNTTNNRYIEDTYERVKSIVKCTASYDKFVYLYDNFSNNVEPTVIYNIGKTYHLQQSILFILGHGTMRLHVNNQEITLNSHSCIFLPAYTTLRIQMKSMETRYMIYRFDPNARTMSSSDMGLYNDNVAAENVYYKRMNDAEFRYIKNHYDELVQALLQKDFKYKQIFVRSYNNIIRAFVINLFNIDSDIKGDAVSRQENLFRRFIDLLNQYASKEREVQFYAEKLGITPKYLSTITNVYSGKNASTWIAEYVVTLAKQLMKEKRCKIQEVSTMLNFPSQSFFGRFFKRTTGISPKRYMLTELK
ncbi:MAG: AraC family transcriptional regulator [Bacteroidaceae bacterium]|nr:AraC family transcriptional regulator [Bacteroidaceae bacterium]